MAESKRERDSVERGPIDDSSIERGPVERGPVERIRLDGHIIDALLLPKVLDIILREGGSFQIVGIDVGKRRQDPSWVEIDVSAADPGSLEALLTKLTPHGVVPVHAEDARFAPADVEGAFPERFLSTTNLETEIRVGGRWIRVEDIEMDCGIVFDPTTTTARCVPMHRIKLGDRVVVGRRGVRVIPQARRPNDPHSFQFMTSAVSSEKPKHVTVRDIAQYLGRTKQAGQKILFVGGPAIIHTGAGEHLCRLIRSGFVNVLFAGNALAAHDIEQSIYHTSLGVHLDKGAPVEEGHEHHLRAINAIRRIGGIQQAVENGFLTSGVMYECVQAKVPYVLAGSIRDDGPLPDVITDAVEAIEAMRRLRDNIGFCLMVATLLHSVATGNILPARVPIACVDINPSTVTKLSDRGTSHSVGIVTDVEPFLREVVAELLGNAT